MKKLCILTLAVTLSVLLSSIKSAQAGVFDLPSFLETTKWSLGLEPEVTISNGTGMGVNFKPRYGVNDLLNVQALLGPGTGARQARVGLLADFEWFPDYQNQPGIATAFFTEYYDLDDGGILRLGAKPMLYKSFNGQSATYTPFLSVPIGWNNQAGKVEGFAQVVLGSMFRVPEWERWKFSAEAGFDAKNAYSYFSGGVTYYTQ